MLLFSKLWLRLCLHSDTFKSKQKVYTFTLWFTQKQPQGKNGLVFILAIYLSTYTIDSTNGMQHSINLKHHNSKSD